MRSAARRSLILQAPRSIERRVRTQVGQSSCSGGSRIPERNKIGPEYNREPRALGRELGPVRSVNERHQLSDEFGGCGFRVPKEGLMEFRGWYDPARAIQGAFKIKPERCYDGGRSGVINRVVCNRCGQRGHVSTDCARETPVCFYCGKRGHIIWVCQELGYDSRVRGRNQIISDRDIIRMINQ